MAEKSLITMSHLNSFGSIINTFAKFEFAMIVALSVVSRVEHYKLMVIARPLQYSTLRDLLYSYMELYEVESEFKAKICSFFDEVDKIFRPTESYCSLNLDCWYP